MLCCLPPIPVGDKDRLETAHRLGAEAKAKGDSPDSCLYGFEGLASEWHRGYNGEPATSVADDFVFPGIER